MGFQRLLNLSVIPFIQEIYPDFRQLFMDNAPYHQSRSKSQFLIVNGVFHFDRLAQSPDLNQIELV